MVSEVKPSLHPIINYLKLRIESLLTLIQLEHDGQPVEPDGFRLKNLSAWSFETHQSVFNNLGSLSSYCNLHCSFCYEEGNPLPYEKSRLSIQEAETRIRYYRSEVQKGLPQFQRKLYKEPFTNNDIIPILKMVRAADLNGEITLVTNGSLLTETMLEQLAQLIPVNISVSVNSSDPQERMQLMNDKKSTDSLKIIEKFKQYGLPFYGSIVAWPTIEAEKLVKTIYFLDKNLARTIRVTLPGYSKYYSQTPPFNTKEVWSEVLSTILPLRNKIKTPILIIPGLYHSRAFLPEIEGIIQNSPADRLGLQFGDVIREINGKKILFRTEAKELLIKESKNGSLVNVVAERRGQLFSVDLEEKEGNKTNYPYRPPNYPASQSFPFGIILIDDFNPSWLRRLLQRINETQAKHILLMTSYIMEPLVAYLLERLPGVNDMLRDKELYLWIPTHRFWGGNIMIGDLYTCSDYLEAVYDFQERQGIKPDLIIIPSSFTYNNNTDLLGVSYSSIEYATGIAVELVRCSPIVN